MKLSVTFFPRHYLLLLCCILFLSFNANSQCRYYVDGSVATTGTGASWASPFKTLNEALNLANVTACTTQEIWVKAGTYIPTTNTVRDSAFHIFKSGIKVYGGFAGGELTLSARNITANPTILSGDIGVVNDTTDNCYHVVTIVNTSGTIDTSTRLDGVTVTGGNGVAAGGSFTVNGFTMNRQDGAGVYVGTATGINTPQIVSCTIQDNSGNFGAGMYNVASNAAGNASPVITSCVFTGNYANNQGGCIYNNGTVGILKISITNTSFSNNKAASNAGAVIDNRDTVTYLNCTFANDTAINGGGGAMEVTGNAQATFTGCTFNNNATQNGRGGAVESGAFTFFNTCSFTGNVCTVGGGALMNGAGGKSMTITNSIFTGNFGPTYGSCIENAFDAVLTITGTSFTSNTANSFGAVYSQNNGFVTLSTCTFTRNFAGSNGGAVMFFGGLGSVTNCTFFGNKSANGGAVYSSNLISLKGNVFEKDTAGSGGAVQINTVTNFYCAQNYFLSNYSTGGGGAMSIFSSTDTLVNNVFVGNKDNGGTGGGALNISDGANLVVNNTFYRDTATNNGGGIRLSGAGTYNVYNNIFSTNRATTGTDVNNVSTGTYTQSNNLFNPVSAAFVNSSNPIGADNIWGTTDDGLKLSTISPALDAGNNTFIPQGIATDAAAAVRIQQGTVDMGAYEGTTLVCPGGTRLYVDSSITSSGTGTSWAQAYKTVWEALTIANDCPAINEIWVKKGTYYPMLNSVTVAGSRDSSLRILRNGIKLYGGFAGTETLLTQQNSTTNKTILSGDIGVVNDSSDNVYHVVTIVGSSTNKIDTNTIVDGFTIQWGRNNGGGSFVAGNGTVMNQTDGGGMLLAGNGAGNECSPLIQNCTFTRNSGIFGGGLYHAGFNGGKSSGVIRNCIFSLNTAADGGGMSGFGDIVSPTITSCTFTGNYGSSSAGGADINGTGGVASPTYTSCVFTGNKSGGIAGGSYNPGSGTGTNLPRYVNCTFTGNVAANGNGGAIYTNNVTVSITGTVFSNNSSTDAGGGGFL